MTDDINQVQNGINMGLRLLLRSPFIVIGSMIMAFTINFKCALVFVVAIPLLFVGVIFIMLVSIPLFKKVQAALDRVTGLTRENLTGVRVIRAFCREEESVNEFEKSNTELTRLNEFVGRISALLNPFTYVLINIATVILIARAGLQVNLGTMHQGQVVALYNYMAQMIVELIKLASLIITLNKAMACADRVAGVLDIRTTMHYPETPSAKADPSANEVEFDKVSFTYAGAGASSLSDISFSVKKGQTVGIIGGTGCGKSTLVSLISRFYDVTCGTVKLNGRNVKELTNQEIHDKVGIVQQRSVLFKGSIRDNMKWGNENASDSEIWDALEVAQAKEVVEGKDGQLDFMLEQNGKNLSGGQRQRLTIARALVKKPEILILDDSLSALDFATDAALRKALAGLEGETTTFLVSQRVAGIRQADKILVLDNGELAGSGTHDELMKSCEVYREIYFSQFPEDRAKYERGEMSGMKKDSVMKKLFKYIGKYWILLILSIILAGISVVLQLYVPVLFGNAIDEIVAAHNVDFTQMWLYLKQILLFVVIVAAAIWIMNLVNNRMTYHIVQDIRSQAIRHIQKLPLSYLDQHSTGDIVSRIIADTDILSDGLLLGFTQLFSGVVTVVVTLIFMFSKNVWITLMVILLTPLSFLVAKFISSRSFTRCLKSRVKPVENRLL